MEVIKAYFNAEKAESLLFIIVGVVAISISSYLLLIIKRQFSNGLAYPLLAIALIQIIVGFSVFLRSPKDISRMQNLITNESAKIKTEEIPRMEVVMKNFEIYRYVEMAFILGGLFLMFGLSGKDFLQGIGIGLFIQSSLMLSFDFFAERRGEEYLKYLIELS